MRSLHSLTLLDQDHEHNHYNDHELGIVMYGQFYTLTIFLLKTSAIFPSSISRLVIWQGLCSIIWTKWKSCTFVNVGGRRICSGELNNYMWVAWLSTKCHRHLIGSSLLCGHWPLDTEQNIANQWEGFKQIKIVLSIYDKRRCISGQSKPLNILCKFFPKSCTDFYLRFKKAKVQNLWWVQI